MIYKLLLISVALLTDSSTEIYKCLVISMALCINIFHMFCRLANSLCVFLYNNFLIAPSSHLKALPWADISISFSLHHITPLHMCLLARRVYRLCLPNCLRQAAALMSGLQIRQWWWAAGYRCQTNRTQDPASGLLGKQEEPSRSEQMGAISDWVSIFIPDFEPDGLSQKMATDGWHIHGTLHLYFPHSLLVG